MSDYHKQKIKEQGKQIAMLEAELARVKVSEKTLINTLRDLLNDCINFDGGKLSDCMLKQAADLLEHKHVCSNCGSNGWKANCPTCIPY